MSYDFEISWKSPPEGFQAAPIVTVTAAGVHDVGRLLNALAHGNSEQYSLAERIARKLRRSRRPGGRYTLDYLENHGGPRLGRSREGL